MSKATDIAKMALTIGCSAAVGFGCGRRSERSSVKREAERQRQLESLATLSSTVKALTDAAQQAFDEERETDRRIWAFMDELERTSRRTAG